MLATHVVVPCLSWQPEQRKTEGLRQQVVMKSTGEMSPGMTQDPYPKCVDIAHLFLLTSRYVFKIESGSCMIQAF